ncbi:MAG: hypothetical protein M3Z41_06850 [Candidatus Eremiobacteraeota bacterium]|nr:hypothetical protein [Candidatus Eremiobacteraeota bacterium]
MTRSLLFAIIIALTLMAAGVAAPTIAAGDVTPAPGQQTAPPDVAAPSPTPEPLLVNGQVIDLERGYVVFASGDAFKLAPNVAIVDDVSSAAPTYDLSPGIYAVATLDVNSGLVLILRTSRRPLTAGMAAAQVPRRYVIAASSPKPNPDLAQPRAAYTSVLSKAVTVTVTASVPADTPFRDDVYMATDTSGWNPQAIKMQRLDGLHFRIQMDLRGGTEIHYLFTRGTWSTVERDRAGLQRKPRSLFVPGGDAQIVDATIYRWADLP